MVMSTIQRVLTASNEFGQGNCRFGGVKTLIVCDTVILNPSLHACNRLVNVTFGFTNRLNAR